MESNERLLSIKHGNNFRDLGGYQTNDGKTVKWHKLIRSGHLHELDQSDLTTLQKLNVAVDIDFRAPMEAKLQPDKVPSNAAYHRLSVFETDKTDASHSQEEIQREYSNNPGAGFNHMVDVYQEMVTTNQAKSAYQKFFRLLIEATSEQSVLYHCTAGKDRTGLGSVFLLSALDVDVKTIENDYLLTNAVTANYVNNRIKDILDAGLPTAFADNTRALATVSPAYLKKSMETINATFGNMPNYLKEHLELSKSDIQILKHNFLDS